MATNDGYDLDNLTLDDLARWWAAHPEERAHVGDACNCVVAKPIQSISGLPCGFVPGDHNITLFREGTQHHEMDRFSPTRIVRVVPLDPAFDELGVTFDSSNPGTEDGWMSAEQCVRLIECVKEDLG